MKTRERVALKRLANHSDELPAVGCNGGSDTHNAVAHEEAEVDPGVEMEILVE